MSPGDLRLVDDRAALRLDAEDGAIVVGSTPDGFAAFVRKEIANNARIVRASGMTAGN